MTGMVVALKGHKTENAEFLVSKLYYPGLPPQPPIKKKV
jgi:hypothetical protein